MSGPYFAALLVCAQDLRVAASLHVGPMLGSRGFASIDAEGPNTHLLRSRLLSPSRFLSLSRSISTHFLRALKKKGGDFASLLAAAKGRSSSSSSGSAATSTSGALTFVSHQASLALAIACYRDLLASKVSKTRWRCKFMTHS